MRCLSDDEIESAVVLLRLSEDHLMLQLGLSAVTLTPAELTLAIERLAGTEADTFLAFLHRRGLTRRDELTERYTRVICEDWNYCERRQRGLGDKRFLVDELAHIVLSENLRVGVETHRADLLLCAVVLARTDLARHCRCDEARLRVAP